jgi:hypothetical protein
MDTGKNNKDSNKYTMQVIIILLYCIFIIRIVNTRGIYCEIVCKVLVKAFRLLGLQYKTHFAVD